MSLLTSKLDLNWTDYICGKSFAQISKWVICDRYQIKFISEEIQENDIVFLNLEIFNQFVNHIYNNRPRHKFILITFNSDKSFTDYHFGLIKDFVVKVYAMNNTCHNEMVKYVPIGFRDWPNETRKEIKEIGNIQTYKPNLVYMNFVIKTNIQKRSECFNAMNHNWVTKKQNIPIHEFYLDLKQSKYAVSPEGTGIDCHRIYECIYFDTIPILKTSLMDDFYKRLPVIIVNSWEEVTENFLLHNYEMYYKKLINWKKENDWLSPKYWLKI